MSVPPATGGGGVADVTVAPNGIGMMSGEPLVPQPLSVVGTAAPSGTSGPVMATGVTHADATRHATPSRPIPRRPMPRPRGLVRFDAFMAGPLLRTTRV